MTDNIIVCPHCDLPISILSTEINCQIFRHGAYINDANALIPPHLAKEECDRLVSEGKIYGCGKPFKFDGINIEVCDYV
jgi:hypothetical protein